MNNGTNSGDRDEEVEIIKPSFKPRAPYILHFEEQTVAVGDPEFLKQIETFLLSADLATRTTYWERSAADDDAVFEPDPEPEDMNAVGIEGDEEIFWNAMHAAIFSRTEWPEDESATVYFPEMPEWLERAQSWYFDPVCPPLGPGTPGGWIRRRSVEERGHPVGLFQLTDQDSFWVFATEEDLQDVIDLCESLARFRAGFAQATPYLGPDDTVGSVALPLICREALMEELVIRGVDVETMFWE
jgi:hypothetical protein